MKPNQQLGTTFYFSSFNGLPKSCHKLSFVRKQGLNATPIGDQLSVRIPANASEELVTTPDQIFSEVKIKLGSACDGYALGVQMRLMYQKFIAHGLAPNQITV